MDSPGNRQLPDKENRPPVSKFKARQPVQPTSKLKREKKRKNTGEFIPLSRRNERERNRVQLLNLGFARLRSIVPTAEGEHLSKISTLKKAIWYIEHLDKVLQDLREQDASGITDAVVQEGQHSLEDMVDGVVGIGLEGIKGHPPSPIFPARLDGVEIEQSTPQQHLFKSGFKPPSVFDSGYESSFVQLPRQQVSPRFDASKELSSGPRISWPFMR